MRGIFKFVTSQDKLYIGFSGSDFHADICNLPPREVMSAGWLHFDVDTNTWEPNGKSIGYRIGFTEADAKKIKQTLAGYTKNSVISSMDCMQHFVIDLKG